MPDAVENVTMTPVQPTQTNVSSIEDYDVWSSMLPTQRAAMEAAWSKPLNIQEELSWKPLNEQIEILNKYEQPEEITNRVDESIQWSEVTEALKESAAKKTEDAKTDIDNSLKELENEMESRKIKQEENDPNNREELTAEEWESHRSLHESLQTQVDESNSKMNQLLKEKLWLENEVDIWKSATDSLKERVKDLQSKSEYYEWSREVIQGPDELQLINLRRSAGQDQSWQWSLLYLDILAQERAAITWQDLTSNIQQLFKDNIRQESKVYASEYQETPVAAKSSTNEIDRYAV